MIISFCYIVSFCLILTRTSAKEGIGNHPSVRRTYAVVEDPGLPDGRPEPDDHNKRENLGRRQLGSVLSRLWEKRENDIVTIPYYIRQSKHGQEYGFSQEA